MVRDGHIVAAAQEERFTRRKHDAEFPRNAINYCLQEVGLRSGGELDLVAFYEKPFLKLERLLSTYVAVAPRGFRSFQKAMTVWSKQKLWLKEIIRQELSYSGRLIFPQHHESHAASAFFPSPFRRAAVLTIDGVGEWATTTIGRGRENHVSLDLELRFPHSLGLLYSAFTYYLGFRVNSGEYKVMGLAPYGTPRYRELILSELVDLKVDGSFRLNLRYFDFLAGLAMTNHRFDALFGGSVREKETALTQRHMDVAASIQAVTGEVMVKMARHARHLTGEANLCLAGGVALNCVGNGRILRERIFDKIWIQPAAGDAGGALGAALLAWYHDQGNSRAVANGRDSQGGSFLGPAYDIKSYVASEKVSATQLSDDELMTKVATLLSQEKVVGWYQGRMEFGPRALGNRSILADARSPTMQQILNLKIKFRESFRPFAPAVLEEKTNDYFDLEEPSPYMLLVASVKTKANGPSIPAVTHLDNSARVQTVSQEDNLRFHRLLSEFMRQTGCAVLVNTSFNVRGEPPVCTPEDAMHCFLHTNMDYLVLGNFLLDKKDYAAVLPTTPYATGTD